MSHRRDFLRALAIGTGAVLLGKGWYRQGGGLLVPEATIETWPGIVVEYLADGRWIPISDGYAVSSPVAREYVVSLSPFLQHREMRARVEGGPYLIRALSVGREEFPL